MKPLLAAKLDWAKVKYPAYVSPKIDGIRCIVSNGRPMSRSWKELPNRHLQGLVAEWHDVLQALDGEIVVGPANAPNTYNRSSSGVMSEGGKPDLAYLVFDWIGMSEWRYYDRLRKLMDMSKSFPPWVKVASQRVCHSREEVEEFEFLWTAQGYEGVVVRSPFAPYKEGRSTVREGYLLKLKRYEDSEAVVIGYEELMHNENEPFMDELGHTKRSSHKAGKVPGNMLGALTVHLLDNPRGPVFNIGSGFDHDTRRALWINPESLKGRVVKFRHLPHGALDAPRHPIFLGFRDERDM